MPLETAQFFLKSRLRLSHHVPIVEVLNYIYKYRSYEKYYRTIRRHLIEMINSVQQVFYRDMCDLSYLDWELDTKVYRITLKGQMVLRSRLGSMYNDGLQYNTYVRLLHHIEIPPIIELKPRIQTSGRIGLDVAILCKKMGEKVGISINDDVFNLESYVTLF